MRDDGPDPASRSADGEHPVTSDDLDRRLDELSGELRLLMPATTVLVAFLLTVPFQSGWEGEDATSRVAYLVAFLSALAAVVLFGGVSAYHRLRGYPYDKEGLLRTANRQAVGGIALLALALGSAAFLVVRVLFGDVLAVVATSALAALAVVTWGALPLSRRRRAGRR
ncbi:DUF6328 family protein [Pseudokineococcus sp. 5B2Z-1]|uniref:DUF6328 family protein n=1 Tax=Pseudokineococcus sp. 5B2Z-1 TaxID=3132744 RepID=UPI0030AF53CD